MIRRVVWLQLRGVGSTAGRFVHPCIPDSSTAPRTSINTTTTKTWPPPPPPPSATPNLVMQVTAIGRAHWPAPSPFPWPRSSHACAVPAHWPPLSLSPPFEKVTVSPACRIFTDRGGLSHHRPPTKAPARPLDLVCSLSSFLRLLHMHPSLPSQTGVRRVNP